MKKGGERKKRGGKKEEGGPFIFSRVFVDSNQLFDKTQLPSKISRALFHENMNENRHTHPQVNSHVKAMEFRTYHARRKKIRFKKERDSSRRQADAEMQMKGTLCHTRVLCCAWKSREREKPDGERENMNNS